MWQSRLLSLAIPVVLRTLNLQTRNFEPMQALLNEKRPFVLMFWHGSMLLPWWYMRKARPAALVSKSKDGQILAEVLEHWNYRVVRGSSSRGSKEAMEIMRRLIDYGNIVCITPDGPRGPRHEMKMGGIRIAQTKDVPLVFCSVRFNKFSKLKSWDQFEIPHLFSKACMTFSDPITVPPELEGPSLDDFRIRLQDEMRTAHDCCQQYVEEPIAELT